MLRNCLRLHLEDWVLPALVVLSALRGVSVREGMERGQQLASI